MRLKRCYIENFGGLSKTTIDFDGHITIIREQNGFGKTTLANFIKAMFYGFSGRGRSIKDNERKKYTPWNGGKFGGYIEFEYGNRQFKLERYFGKTPRYDEIRFYDLATNRISNDCSSEPGTKLFGLDADSFIRSIYIEESPVQGSFETDSIKARLANLVDDSDDVNNFEKANKVINDKLKEIASIRRENSLYKTACNNISSADNSLAAAKQLASLEDKIRSGIEADRSAIDEAKIALDEIKQKINAANSVSARKAVVDQIDSLGAELAKHRDVCTEFERNFPNGVPNGEETKLIQDKLEAIIGISASRESDAREKIEARPGIQQIKAMFADSIPEEDQISEYREKLNRIIAIEARRKQQSLTDIKQDRFIRLKEKFKLGVPSDVSLANASILNDEIAELDGKAKSIDINSAKLNLALYEQYFSDGVPARSEIDEYRSKASEVSRLRDLNNRLACEIGGIPNIAATQEDQEEIKTCTELKGSNKSKFGVIIGSVIMLIGAVTGLTINGLGFIGTGLGALIVLASFLMKPKRVSDTSSIHSVQKTSNEAKVLRDKMIDNSTAISELEASIQRFLSQFAVKGDGILEKLSDLDAKVTNYSTEKARVEALEIELKQLELTIAEKKQKLSELVGKYIDLSRPFADGMSSLKAEISEYYSLQSEASSFEQAKLTDMEELDRLAQQVLAFLGTFYRGGKVSIDKASEYLDILSKSVFEYRKYISDIQAIDEANAKFNESEQSVRGELRALLSKYRIDDTDFSLDKLKEISRLGEEYFSSIERVTSIKKQIADIRENNQEILSYSSECSDGGIDIDELKNTEKELIDDIGKHQVSIANLEDRLNTALDAADRIPELEEQLAYWENERDTCLNKADTLNKLLKALEKAKDNLSTQYLSHVEKSFNKYLTMISPHIGEKAKLSSDLNVLVTEFGAFKEQDFLSSGESDLINLCMRLSLIDAMFRGEQTFIIMDDPFIHLDDDKMGKISELMRSISEDYQIIYLTCSKSRDIA